VTVCNFPLRLEKCPYSLFSYHMTFSSQNRYIMPGTLLSAVATASGAEGMSLYVMEIEEILTLCLIKHYAVRMCGNNCTHSEPRQQTGVNNLTHSN
jgi:hypothetical protein